MNILARKKVQGKSEGFIKCREDTSSAVSTPHCREPPQRDKRAVVCWPLSYPNKPYINWDLIYSAKNPVLWSMVTFVVSITVFFRAWPDSFPGVFQLWWTWCRTLWAAVADSCCSTRRRRSAARRRRSGPSSRRVCTARWWRTPWAWCCWSCRRSASRWACLTPCASSRTNRELCRPGREGRGGRSGTGSQRSVWPLWCPRRASGGRCATICLSEAKLNRETGLVSRWTLNESTQGSSYKVPGWIITMQSFLKKEKSSFFFWRQTRQDEAKKS